MLATIPNCRPVQSPANAEYHHHVFADFRGKTPCTRRLMIDIEPCADGFEVVVRGEDKLVGHARAARIWNAPDGTARRFVVAKYQDARHGHRDVKAVITYFLAANEFSADRVARLTTAGAIALARVIELGVGVAPWAATAGKVGSFAGLGLDRRVRRVASVRRAIAAVMPQDDAVDVDAIVDQMIAKIPAKTTTATPGPTFKTPMEDVRDAQALRPHFSKSFLARCSAGDPQALALKTKIEREHRQQVDAWRRRVARVDTKVRPENSDGAPSKPAGITSIDAQAEREGAALDRQDELAAERRLLLQPVTKYLPGIVANRGNELDKGNRVVFAGAYRRHDATLAWLRILDRETWMKATFRTSINPTRSDKHERERRRLRRELSRSLVTLRDHVKCEQVDALVEAGPRAVIVAAERLAVTV